MLIGVCYFSCRRYYTFRAMPEPKQKERSRDRSRGRSRTRRRSPSSSSETVVPPPADKGEKEVTVTESRPPPPDLRVAQTDDGHGRSKSRSPARKEPRHREPSTEVVCEICQSEVKGGPVGLKMHQESSKHCLSYLYWHKGYEWNEAKQKAHAKWKAWTKRYYRRKEPEELKRAVRLKSQPRRKSPSLRRKSPRRGEKESARAKSPERRSKKSHKNDEKVEQPAKRSDPAKSKDLAKQKTKKDPEDSPYSYYEYSDSAEDDKGKNDHPKSSGSQAAKQAPLTSKKAPPAPTKPTLPGPALPLLALAEFYESQANFMRRLT